MDFLLLTALLLIAFIGGAIFGLSLRGWITRKGYDRYLRAREP